MDQSDIEHIIALSQDLNNILVSLNELKTANENQSYFYNNLIAYHELFLSLAKHHVFEERVFYVSIKDESIEYVRNFIKECNNKLDQLQREHNEIVTQIEMTTKKMSIYSNVLEWASAYTEMGLSGNADNTVIFANHRVHADV